MEFGIKRVIDVEEVKGNKLNNIILYSTKIVKSNEGLLSYDYIEYRIEFDGKYYIYSTVSTGEINGKYEIMFECLELYGSVVNKFIEYLKENHEKNIVELSI